jgi:CBS domain-containing protein
MKARDIMTPNPECLTPDDTLSRAAQLMRDLNVGAIPVVDDRDGRRLTGIITDRDIAVRHLAEGHTDDCRVQDHMTSGRLDTVSPDDDVNQVFQAMERDQVRRIPVVEDGDRLVGIIAQADIAVRTQPPESDRVDEVVERISQPARPERS